MATKKIVNIYKVKQDIQGAAPSGISDDNFEKLNILNNTIDLKNISPWYNQYANIDGNFLEYEEPTNWYKKMYGIDTTWELMFNTDSVAFITEGQYSNDGRSNGIQEDAIRDITGGFNLPPFSTSVDIIHDPYGCFRSLSTSRPANSLSYSSVYNSFKADFKASNVVPTAQVNRMRNRLIRVYHLLSINGVNISDIMEINNE